MVQEILSMIQVSIIGIFLTMLIKFVSKPDDLKYRVIDWFDFGDDLIVSAITLLFFCNVTIDQRVLLVPLVIVLITSTIVRRKGWNENKDDLNNFGIIFKDVIGIIMLAGTTLYLGGCIQ